MTQGTIDPPNTPPVLPELAEKFAGSRIRWSAIFGGAFAALGIWALLYALGLALGLSTVNPNDPSSIKPSGIFTGIWSIVTPLIALFFGGFVASRAAGVLTRGNGVMHGLIVWGLTTVVGAWFLANLISSVVGGAVSLGGSALQAGGGAIASAAGAGGANVGKIAQSLGIDANDAIAPINQRLQAQGKPTVTADQVEKAAKSAVQDAVRTGQLNRDTLVGALADNTNLSRDDAEDVADRLQSQFDDARARAGSSASNAADQAQTKALQAADTTGKAFWGIFGALLLGMLSSLAGGAAGASARMRDWADRAEYRARHQHQHA